MPDVEIKTGRPVESFPMEYSWRGGEWEALFDEQIKLVRSDVVRAKTADKLVVYLSCPISSRGGGNAGANVDIALATQRRLLNAWGEGAWILNPANYQMESRAGTGLMNMHAERLGIDLQRLVAQTGLPGGGDYMRMWTKVLVENPTRVGRVALPDSLLNTGQYFDAYYFLGPKDVHRFFQAGEESLTASIETYFARRMQSDPTFRDTYSVPGITWGAAATHPASEDDPARDNWRQSRNAFLRFYMFRAGANFSLGSHDEWNIYLQLNRLRRAAQGGGVGEQLAGFFSEAQIDLASTEQAVSNGYAR